MLNKYEKIRVSNKNILIAYKKRILPNGALREQTSFVMGRCNHKHLLGPFFLANAIFCCQNTIQADYAKLKYNMSKGN